MAKKTAAPTVAEAHAYCADGCGARVNSPKSTFLQGHDQRLISDLSTRVVSSEMGAFQRALLGLVDDPKATAADEFYYGETDDIMDRINTVSAAIAARFSTGLSGKFSSAAMAKWEKYGRQTERAAQKALRVASKSAAKANAESPATKAVFRNLQKPDGQPNSAEPIGASFNMDDQFAFENQARAYLGDKTNLKQATIDAADWKKVYEYFASGLVSAEPVPARVTGADKKTVGQPIQNLRGTEVKVKIGRWTYDATVIGMSQAGKVTAVEYVDKKGEEKTTDRFTLVEQDAAAPELRKLLKLQ